MRVYIPSFKSHNSTKNNAPLAAAAAAKDRVSFQRLTSYSLSKKYSFTLATTSFAVNSVVNVAVDSSLPSSGQELKKLPRSPSIL